MSKLVSLRAVAALVAVAGSILGSDAVKAGNISSDKATALTGNGVVTVQAESTSTSDGTSAKTPSSGVICTDTPLPPTDAALLGSGGTGPGIWVLPYCVHDGYVNPLAPLWVSASAPVAATSPRVAARDALAQIALPLAEIEMAPSANSEQLTDARTWLWINPSLWHSYSATASVGRVTATATATPSRVVWDMGDGNTVTCNGPGTSYDASAPEAVQSTDCSYLWRRSSADESGGAFTVTATVYWQVTWVARGAAGGGSLGQVASPPATVDIRVAEAQAVNGGT